MVGQTACAGCGVAGDFGELTEAAEVEAQTDKTANSILNEQKPTNKTMKPNKWICDYCGQPIRSADQGWVEYIVPEKSGKPVGHSARIVHAKPYSPRSPGNSCQYSKIIVKNRYHGVVYDMPLDTFAGPDGLMALLEDIGTGAIRVMDVLELIKRIHIPGYEAARSGYDEAIASGILQTGGPEGYPTQEEIRAVLAMMTKNMSGVGNV